MFKTRQTRDIYMQLVFVLFFLFPFLEGSGFSSWMLEYSSYTPYRKRQLTVY